MASAPFRRPTRHPNGQEVRLVRLAVSPTVNLRGRSADVWDAADTTQRLIELDDEARALNSAEEYAESHARLTAVLGQHEERAPARYHALHNRNDPDADQGSVNIRSRPLDSQFGSDGNQYNPYAPFTSEEYMLQEIEAGRMNPEMMDTPQQASNPAQSPLPENHTAPQSAHVHAGSHTSWMAPDHRPPCGQILYNLGQVHDLSDPHEASWFQHPYADITASEDLGEEEYADPALHHTLENEQRLIGPHRQESLFGSQGPLTLTTDQASPNERSARGVPRQPHSASTGRERRRLARPSLIVKLKTRFTQSSQAPLSPRRGRRGASSSRASNLAAQPTQNSRPFNLRSQGSVGSSSGTASSRVGWEHTARTLTRRAEAIQSPQRKRRRDAVSPRDASVESTTTPIPGSTHGN